jgi:hypothetical protein
VKSKNYIFVAIFDELFWNLEFNVVNGFSYDIRTRIGPLLIMRQTVKSYGLNLILKK